MKRLFIILVIGILAGGCRRHEETPEEKPTHRVLEYDVAYGNHPHQRMDVFIPEGDRDTMGLMVMVHGGSWVSGDKSDWKDWFDYEVFHEKYAVINLNYRLDDRTTRPLPMQTDDIGTAIETFRQKYRMPATRIAVLGGSAGAHLVSQYAYTYPDKPYIKAVVNFVGPVDFNDPTYHTPGHWEWIFSGIEYIFNLPYAGNEAIYAQWSPISHVDANKPPTIMFYGGQDTLVPYTNGERLHARLDSAGVENEYYLYPQSGHSFNYPDGWDAAIKAEDFVDRHLPRH